MSGCGRVLSHLGAVPLPCTHMPWVRCPVRGDVPRFAIAAAVATVLVLSTTASAEVAVWGQGTPGSPLGVRVAASRLCSFYHVTRVPPVHANAVHCGPLPHSSLLATVVMRS